jgi:hypothetical protein
MRKMFTIEPAYLISKSRANLALKHGFVLFSGIVKFNTTVGVFGVVVDVGAGDVTVVGF